MADEIKRFLASDAFTYVDTYRDSILKSAVELNGAKERLQNRFWESSSVDSRFYAELRAVEHALDYVLKGSEPGMVVLGDESKQAGTEAPKGEVERCQQALQALSEEKDRVDRAFRTLTSQASELQAQLVQQHQVTNALKRRLVQNSSTFVVIAATMFAVILTLLWVLWGR
jgi:hypothetical protein